MMNEYIFKDDGSVSTGSSGQVVAFFESDGRLGAC
jgi:hypothetical protein